MTKPQQSPQYTKRTSSKKTSTTPATGGDYGSCTMLSVGEQYLIPIEFRDGSSSSGSSSVATESTVTTSSLSSYYDSTMHHDPEEETTLLVSPPPLNVPPPPSGTTTCADAVFITLFGFDTNPMLSSSSSSSSFERHRRRRRRNTARDDLQLAMWSNFSTAYNVLSISWALQMMAHSTSSSSSYSSISSTTSTLLLKYYLTPGDTSLCSSALMVGMILGQLMGGTLGDVWGRHVAMSLVMLLQIVAAVGSSLSLAMVIPTLRNHHHQVSIFKVVAVWRFLLGLGCGGVYPLSATLTTESNSHNSSSSSGSSSTSHHHHHHHPPTPRDRAKSVALTFSFQGVGYMVVPAVAYIIVQIFGESSDYGWRLLLGLGSVPGILLTIGRQTSSRQQRQKVHPPQNTAVTASATTMIDPTLASVVEIEPPPLPPLANNDDNKNTSLQSHRTVPISIWEAIRYERQLVRKLLGTAGSWFIFDILFYGNVLFQPVVLNAAFGRHRQQPQQQHEDEETLSKMCYHAFLLSLMALPGYYISIYAVGRQSPRDIQIQGFFLMGLLYLTIGTLFDTLSQHSVALLTLYGLTFFFSNYGPNATTFMLPSMTFSKACRSTLNGICAACGKAGALIGATVFVAAHHQYGAQVVFFSCSLLAFAGCLLTLLCVSGRVGQHTNADEEEEEYQRQLDRTMDELNGGAARRPVTMRMVYSHPSIFDSYPHE